MNKRFQLYKKCGVVLVDKLEYDDPNKEEPWFKLEDIHLTDIVFDERPKEKYNRAKENREFRKRCDEEWER